MGGYEAFTPAWASAWCAALNASEGYRRAAASWQDAVALVMSADAGAGIPAPRAVFLDLAHGACRGARVASEADLAAAAYVLEATPAAWRDVLEGRTSPITALMMSRLRLVRGSLASLLPYAGAAAELVAVAAQVETVFPSAVA